MAPVGVGHAERIGSDCLTTVAIWVGADPDEAAGWNEESARLFALDSALLTLIRHRAGLPEPEALHIGKRLAQARKLTVIGQHTDLGHICNELLHLMNLSVKQKARAVWLTALNALLPNPYRAARAAVESAIVIDEELRPNGDPPIQKQMRECLLGRMSEGAAIEKLCRRSPAQLARV